MTQIVAVESSYFGCGVRLASGDRVQLLGLRLPDRWLVTVTVPRSLPRAANGMPELPPQAWRGTQLIDFLDAEGEQHIGTVRQRFVPDAFAELAQVGAARLRAWIADALELDGAERAAEATRLVIRARRFAVLLQASDASGVLDEIRRQPDVEQLIALDNAVVRWSATPIAAPDRHNFVRETRVLADVAAPGMSTPWHRWMWHLARATSRAELTAVVDAALADADRRCLAIKLKKKQASAEREEARRLAAVMRTATLHQLEMHPPARDLFSSFKDSEVFHSNAFIALTQVASAISLAASAAGESLEEANLGAMRAVAELALDVLGAT